MEKGDKKIKLLIITQAVDKDDSNLGFFHEWLREFSNQADELIVITLREGKIALPENVKVFSLGKNKGFSKIHQFWLFQKYLSRFLGNVDGVFVHMCPEYAIAAAFLVKLRGKRMILWYTHKSVTNKLKLAERFSDKVLTASKESFRLPSKKLVVMGHGINTENFKYQENNFDPDNIKLLSVGRICPTKDLETSIQALAKIKARGINATLDIVGEPYLDEDRAYLEALKMIVDKMGLEEEVHFIGAVPNDRMPAVYQDRNMLLHSSTTGSMDKVVLEALACGRYVLSSSEAFQDLGEQFIWTPNNADSLAEKIIDVAQRQPDISSLCRRVIENNSLDNLIKRIISYY